MQKKVSIRDMIDEMNLDCINYSSNDKFVYTSDINRPGMQLIGYYEHFPIERIQVIGNAEYAYLQSLDLDERIKKLDKFLSYDLPLVCVARDHKIDDYFVELAKKYDKFLIVSELQTTRLISKISEYINHKTAPVEVRHGVLVDVDGLGVLIMGDSGVGKSESALELIKRGHRLVSDDAVEIKRFNETITGQSPELTRYMIEIRGIGLLDIKSLYGVGAIKLSTTIDLIANIEPWDDKKYYDRLGMDENFVEILGVKVPQVTLPVKPGRNMAVILEIAARNQRQKLMGYNSAIEFNKKLISKLSQQNLKGINEDE